MAKSRKVDIDPFSNGTEHMWWLEHNCERCWKSSHLKKNSDEIYAEYTKYRCKINYEIDLRMFSNEEISERTYTICNDFIRYGKLCPYLQEKQKKYPKKDKNQLDLFQE